MSRWASFSPQTEAGFTLAGVLDQLDRLEGDRVRIAEVLAMAAAHNDIDFIFPTARHRERARDLLGSEEVGVQSGATWGRGRPEPPHSDGRPADTPVHHPPFPADVRGGAG